MTGLSLRLGADASGFKRGLDEATGATKQLGGASRDLTGREKALLAATVALAAGIGIYMKKAIDAADAASKLSEKTGISTERLTGMRLTAELAGTSVDSMAKGFKKLQKGLFEGVTEGIGPTKDSLDAMGISLVDAEGAMRSSEAVVADIADTFALMENGAAKAALAQDLLGRAGVDMIPLLNQGSEAVKRLHQESVEMGRVWSEETAQSAEDFNDAITRLKATGDGFFQTAAQFYIPVMADVVGGMALMARAAVTMTWPWERGKKGREEVSKAIEDQADKVLFLKRELKAYEDSDSQNPAWLADRTRLIAATTDEIKRQVDVLRNLKGEVGAEVGIINAETLALRKQAAARAAAIAAGQTGAGGPGAKVPSTKAAAEASDPQAAALDARTKAAQQYATALEALEAQERRLIVASLEGGHAVLARLEDERRAVEAQRDHALANEDLLAAERERIAAAAADTIVALEHDAQREIFALRAAGADDAERLHERRVRSAERAGQQEQAGAFSVANSLIGLTETISSAVMDGHASQTAEGKKAARQQFAAQQAVAFAIASVQMALGIAMASASAPAPANIPAIVAAVATGIGTLATIAGTTIAGVADGGLMPDTLRKAGLNRHSVLAVRNDEMVLPPQATRDMVDTMALAKRASFSQAGGGGGGGTRYVNDRPVILNGREVGRIMDDHLIRSEERGLGYGHRVRTRMTA